MSLGWQFVSQNNVRMVSRGATFEFSNFFTGEGYNFLGSHFKGVQDFWAVNLRGAKIFGQ